VEALYKAYKDNEKVAMYLVYVNEAHPARTTAAKSEGPSSVGKHKSIDEKVLAASKCMEGLKMTLPILIDSMDGVVEKAYRGRPAATAVIDLDGKVVFHSTGPRGAQPPEADKHLKALIAKGGFPKIEKKPERKPTTQPAETNKKTEKPKKTKKSE
jgi:hypothetical protein